MLSIPTVSWQTSEAPPGPDAPVVMSTAHTPRVVVGALRVRASGAQSSTWRVPCSVASASTSAQRSAPSRFTCRASRHRVGRRGDLGGASTSAFRLQSHRHRRSPRQLTTTNAKEDSLEMDLVWDQSHPKYLQFTGASLDESDSSDEESPDEKSPDAIADDNCKPKPDPPARPSVLPKRLDTSSRGRNRVKAQGVASWEESKLQRRLGGVGGGEGARAMNGEKFSHSESAESAPSKLGAAWEGTDTLLRKVNPSSSRGGYEYADNDPVWDIICILAKKDAASEPLLSSYMYSSVLSHDTLEQAMSFVLANRLADSTLLPTQLMEIFNSVLFADDAEGVFVRSALRKDICAIRERDPACSSYVHALLYLKGFHALQAHRVQHALWNRGQKLLALTLQARISTVFAVDLHPAAKLGKGILIDHGTGVVIGETAVVGDNVSILQGVTLGGTGKDCGDRHPKIGKNVLIGAHSTILGNITIGKGAMIAAGSLVLKNVAPHTMVAGAPAREVGKTRVEAPALDMKQELESSANGAASLDGGGTADAPAAGEADTSKIKSQTKVRRGGGGDAARWADRLPEGDGSWYI